MGDQDANQQLQEGTFTGAFLDGETLVASPEVQAPGDVASGRPFDKTRPDAGAALRDALAAELAKREAVKKAWQDRWTVLPETTFSEPPPARRWLLKRGGAGILPLGKVGMLAGEGGAGKTMAEVQLAIAVATGTLWLDTFQTDAGRVLLVLGEEDAEEVRRRMYNAGRALKLSPAHQQEARANIVVMPLAGVTCPFIEPDQNSGHLEDAPFLTWLREQLATDEWKLIILDPLSRFAGADAEKDNAAATRFIQSVESLVSSHGSPTVLVAHHTNKGARTSSSETSGTVNASRGSSALTDGARWFSSLDVERIEGVDDHLREIVTFSIGKSNYALRSEPLRMRRDREWGGALRALSGSDEQMIVEAKNADSENGRGAGSPKGKREVSPLNVAKIIASNGIDDNGYS